MHGTMIIKSSRRYFFGQITRGRRAIKYSTIKEEKKSACIIEMTKRDSVASGTKKKNENSKKKTRQLVIINRKNNIQFYASIFFSFCLNCKLIFKAFFSFFVPERNEEKKKRKKKSRTIYFRVGKTFEVAIVEKKFDKSNGTQLNYRNFWLFFLGNRNVDLLIDWQFINEFI